MRGRRGGVLLKPVVFREDERPVWRMRTLLTF